MVDWIGRSAGAEALNDRIKLFLLTVEIEGEEELIH
jgi:hypothetical protein